MTSLLMIALLAGAPTLQDFAVLKEDYQVLQRDEHDMAACWVFLPGETAAGVPFIAQVADDGGTVQRKIEHPASALGDARAMLLDELPVGGPYSIAVSTAEAPEKTIVRFEHVLVGDIWILGGQSNMYGADIVREKLPALPYLNMLDVRHLELDAHWAAAVPPIHRIPEPFASFTLRAQHPEFTPQRVAEIIASQTPVGGIDPSYFFARALYEQSGVPLALVPCAMGGSLSMWDPANRAQNRYGFVEHHVRGLGGRVKGLLFFQGEQDAIFGEHDRAVSKPSEIGPLNTYSDRFIQFAEALRHDFADENMPVIFAQIGRHHNGPADRESAWESVRDQQRRLPERLLRSHCIPSLDLNVMDGLHFDYDAMQAMGNRMAYVALPYVKPDVPTRQEIRLRSVVRGETPRPTIVVTFDGVTGQLKSPGRPAGFVLKTESGEPLDWIFKTDLDPARPGTVILHATAVPPDVRLYYGAGPAPYVNIVDDNNMPLPAFGPVEIE